MIITCEECSTSFHLDDSLLKPEGSKVRCSRCRNVFTAFPPEKEIPAAPDLIPISSHDEPETAGPLDVDREEAFDFGTQEDSPAMEEEELDFSDMDFDTDFDDSDLETEDSGLKMEVPPEDEANIEISFDDRDGILDIDSSDLTLEMEEDASLTMDFGQGLEMEDESKDDGTGDALDLEPEKLEFETENLTVDEPDSDLEPPGDEPVLEMEAPDSGTDDDLFLEEQAPEFELDFDEDKDLSLEPETGPIESEERSREMEPPREAIPDTVSGDGKEPAEEEEIDFSGYDEILDQDVEPEIQAPVEPEDQEADRFPGDEARKPESARIEKTEPEILALPVDSPRRKRRKKSSLGAPVILLLIVFLITAGAYVVSMFMGYKIPFLSQVKIPYIEQFMGKTKAEIPEPKPVPSQKNVNGRFVSNDTAGELFIITGKVDNPAKIPYQYIQVKGTLLTKGKVKAMTQTAFCGNIISEEVLKTGNITDINKQMTVREGMNGANLNVRPGGSVPFMLVFSNLPENLQNFTVEVEEFSKIGDAKK